MSKSKNSQSLDEILKKRNPVTLREQRQVIKPVDILAPQTNKATTQQVDKTTSILVGKPTNPQVSNPTSRKAHKPTKPQIEKPTTQQNRKTTSTPVVKYTTHLRSETIKAIKQYSLDHDEHDYDIVQEAMDYFFSLKD